ncbi:MAG TPA: Vms1/Ankzf1 family peptidyl-tRNA hydrolase [Pilimelia sp.]|nr:Vms1/Ankzf1 family peptidyl-tRNA hydrolase [Pilimelia sp.]
MNLQFLRPLYSHPGPWASVYLDVTGNVANAAAEREIRWRHLRDGLREAGADAGTVAALNDAVLGEEPPQGRSGLALFATEGTVVLSEVLGAPPRTEIADWSPLPHVMPLLAQRGEEVAWLRVVADRTGADLEGVAAGGVSHAVEVAGSEEFPIRKIKPGGWSQRRYQQAAEETWHRNAGDVAAAAAELADRIGAEVLVVGGDVHAVQQLIGQLPVRWQERAVRTDAGSRGAGADPTALDDVTVQAVAEVAERHTRAALDRFAAQHGQGTTADTGLAAAISALQRGQAEALFLVDDASANGRLWVGPEPTHLAAESAELRQMGVAAPVVDRADAALVRALACTDGELVFIGEGEAPLVGGVGVLLRYADVGSRRG